MMRVVAPQPSQWWVRISRIEDQFHSSGPKSPTLSSQSRILSFLGMTHSTMQLSDILLRCSLNMESRSFSLISPNLKIQITESDRSLMNSTLLSLTSTRNFLRPIEFTTSTTILRNIRLISKPSFQGSTQWLMSMSPRLVFSFVPSDLGILPSVSLKLKVASYVPIALTRSIEQTSCNSWLE